MESLTLTGLTSAVLTQGISFLYAQAGEILRSRRARLKGADAEVPIPSVASEVVDGALVAVVPDWSVVDGLESDLRELRRQLADYVDGVDEPEPTDERTLRLVDALRRSVELALGQRITFKGENRGFSEPLVVGTVEINDVHGYVAAVRARWITGGHIEAGARVETVREGAEVIAIEADRIGPKLLTRGPGFDEGFKC